MTENISLVERIVRVLLGIILILGYMTHFWQISVGISATMELALFIIGAILFTTGATGYCPIYNMCLKKEEEVKEELPVRNRVEVVETESVGEIAEEKKVRKKRTVKKRQKGKQKATKKTTKATKSKKSSRKTKKSKKK